MKKYTRLLIRAAREGNLQLARALVDSYGLSHHPEWSNGYKFLRIAVKNNKTDFVKLLLSRGCSVKGKKKALLSTPLHFAVRNGNIGIIKLLLNNGAAVNDNNKFGKTPLAVAVDKGSSPIVNLLLKHAANVNSKDKTGMTPLHISCKRNLPKIAKTLLKNGANVNARTKINQTPLHIAVRTGSRDVVNILFHHGADVDCEDKSGSTPLRNAVNLGDVSIVKDILEHQPDVNIKGNHSCLELAVRSDGENYAQIVLALLEYGFTAGPKSPKCPYFLNLAARKGNVTVVRGLLKYGANVNYANPLQYGGCTPLHLAVKSKNEEVTQLLIDSNAEINAKDRHGRPPIFYSVENVDSKMTLLLLSYGANVTDFPQLLHTAVRKNSIKIIEDLLLNGADLNARDEYGRSAMHFTVFNENGGRGPINFETDEVYSRCHNHYTRSSLKKTQFLLGKGANLDAQTQAGVTILHGAIYMQLDSITELLMAHNVNVNLKDQQGATPLHVSVHRENKDLSIELLDKGAEVNAKMKNGTTALDIALAKDNSELVKFLLARGAQVRCNTPLHLAGSQTIMEMLLVRGANVNARREDGKTALHLWAERGNVNAVRRLLEYGADVNIECNESRTPLDTVYSERMIYVWNFGELSHYQSNNRTVDDLLRHHYKMEIAELYVTKPRLGTNRLGHGKFEYFLNRCRKEVEKMENEFVTGTDVSYFELLRKDSKFLEKFMKNENVVEASKSENYWRMFPEYEGMIKCQFRRGLEKIKLNELACRVLYRLTELPEDCICEILDYLSEDDLRVLIDV